MNQITQGLYDESATQQEKLGQLYISPSGEKYRYVKAGGSALVTGTLLQESAEDVQFRSMAVAAAAAIGATQVSVTLGSTATTANMFDEGYAYIESSTGIGQAFRIKAHTVASGAATCVFTLDRPLKIALTTSSQFTARKNPYKGVIINPTTMTGGVIGVALYAMTASYFGWVQTGGDCPVLFDTGTNTSDAVTGLGPSAAVAGSVKPVNGAEGGVYIGYAREVVSVDSTMGLAHLMLD